MADPSNLFSIKEPATPELDREATHTEEVRIILDFLKWLKGEWYTQEVNRRRYERDEWNQDERSAEDVALCDVKSFTVLHEYFNLDPDKLEHERQLMLLYARKVAEAFKQERALEDEDLTQAEKALLIHSRVREAEKRIRKEMGL